MHRAMRAGLVLIAGVSIAGCPASEPIAPDAGSPLDGAPIEDAPPSASRLTIAWNTLPTIPGTTTSGHRLDEVRFRMENLKASVDTDPQAPNTTKAEVELKWERDEMPPSITFQNAPAGRYTSVVLKLDEGSDEDAFFIRGVSNDNDSFRFEGSASLSISMSTDLELAPGDDRTIVIDIDLDTAVDAIDIESLDGGEGVDHLLEADDEPEATALFRSKLQSAFSCRVQ